MTPSRHKNTSQVLSYLPDKNTVEWWLLQLPDGYKRRAFKNHFKQGIALHDPAHSVRYALDRSFVWSDTDEGNRYWYDLDRRLSELSRADG